MTVVLEHSRTPSAATPREPVRPRLVLLGGVPGAGKTTALVRLARWADVEVLDPEVYRAGLRARLPRVPYRVYRPLVHTAHATRVLATVLRGPRGRSVVVHEPGTRPRRNALLARLAARRGFEPVLVVVDVSREAALAGQHRRGRVVASRSFEGHWRRWVDQRPRLLAAQARRGGWGGWRRVFVVPREAVYETVTRVSSGAHR